MTKLWIGAIVGLVSAAHALADAGVRTDSPVSKRIKDEIRAGHVRVDLRALTDFDWDQLYRFAAYSDEDGIEKSLGFSLPSVKESRTPDSGDLVLLVFVKEGHVVHAFDHPRTAGDFSFIENNPMPREDAVFMIPGTSLGNPYLWPVSRTPATQPAVTKNKLVNEIVMSPGMFITAMTSEGTIRIDAGKGLERSYTWEGATRSLEMLPRHERWYGSLGLYCPGPGEHWKEHNGITRAVVEEGQQHFSSEEQALAWLVRRTWMSYVWRSDGLVVGWGKTLERRQLNVEVWQITINGQKPTKLTGSQDEKILLTSGVRGAATAP